MNTGIIASRYATALLKLVDETGSGESVAAQVQVIEAALDGSQEFRHAVADPAVSPESKLGLFEAAVAPLAPELRKFIQLLIRNGRIGDARLVFTTFITEYYRARHIKRARLVVADGSLLSSAAVVRQAHQPIEAPENIIPYARPSQDTRSWIREPRCHQPSY